MIPSCPAGSAPRGVRLEDMLARRQVEILMERRRAQAVGQESRAQPALWATTAPSSDPQSLWHVQVAPMETLPASTPGPALVSALQDFSAQPTAASAGLVHVHPAGSARGTHRSARSALWANSRTRKVNPSANPAFLERTSPTLPSPAAPAHPATLRTLVSRRGASAARQGTMPTGLDQRSALRAAPDATTQQRH